jgi:hypothetical protein
MADYQAIGAMTAPIKTPDTFGQLSNILGIQSQRQELQIQAQKLQQAQMQTEATKGVQDFFTAWDPSDNIAPDGTTDINGVHGTAAYKGLNGLSKQAVDNHLVQIKQGQLQNAQSLQTLDANTQQQLFNNVSGLMGDPDVQAADKDPDAAARAKNKITQAFQDFSKQSPEAARVAGIYSKIADAKPEHLNDALYALNLANASAQERNTQTQPQQTSNAAQQIVNRNVRTGALSAPPQAGADLNPSAPTVAATTKRVQEAAGSDFDRANQVSAAVAPAKQTVQLSQQVDDLADQVHSGKFADAISKAAAAAGMTSDTYARQLLKKDLGKIQASATAAAPSDKRSETILSGFPDATSDTRTIHTAMDYTRGVARQDLARGELLNSVKAKDASLRGFQHADDVLTSTTDPLMHEFNALPKGAARQEFYKRNFSTRAQAEEFTNKLKGLGHLNVIGQ